MTDKCTFTNATCDNCPSPTCYYEPDDCEDDWGEKEAECEAFGGVGCKHLRCQHWGGDGLCFIAMNEGY